MQERKAIVFIHGFLGSNKQFRGIKALLDGCGVDFIDHVVDGHGGTLDEFVASNDESWQDGFNEHLERLRGEYDALYLVGHSMGGLLAVRAAVASPERICGIAAIAFPARIAPSMSWVGGYFNAAGPKSEGEDPRVTFSREVSGVEIKGAREVLRAMPNALRFLRLAKRTREALPGLRVPLTVINNARDEIVSKRVPDFVKEKLPASRVMMMKNSYHFLFDAEDEKQMAEAVRDMITT